MKNINFLLHRESNRFDCVYVFRSIFQLSNHGETIFANFDFLLSSLSSCRSRVSIVHLLLSNSTRFVVFSAQTSAHFCTSVQTVTKNDTCPNPATFNATNEHNKADTTWKLDFKVSTWMRELSFAFSLRNKVFQQAGIKNSYDLLNEIKQLYNAASPCPYTR